MTSWAEVRRLARAWHGDLYASADLSKASVLLDAAAGKTGVKVLFVAADSILLDGAEACYDSEGPRIVVSEALSKEVRAFTIAHEYAHMRLHAAGALCSGDDIDVFTAAEPEMSLVGDPDTYSPKQRTEAQANLFAREFLLPRDKIRRLAEAGPTSARALAPLLGLSCDLIKQQMADALLLPDEPERPPRGPEDAPDDSQREAIEAAPSPRMLRAGPGTGKTRTLVGRIAHLAHVLKVPPEMILALTYSNESSRDLSERIRNELGAQATAVWTGTFHAFGLELLRQHGAAIGLPSPKLVDRADALLLLEEVLGALDLDYYLDLNEPLRALKAVLGAIGRAKDELRGPADYAALAEAIDDPVGKARALEAARIYSVYEAALRERGAVDFGDLIARSVELLHDHRDVAEKVRAQFRYVLVDEYQDMNRASGKLLAALVGANDGPWVVGDVRQAIYRFRGASPLNMTEFGTDFSGEITSDLNVNYRSGGNIVRAFEAFGSTMQSAALAPGGKLVAKKGESEGALFFNTATTREAEAFAIGQSIKAASPDGKNYRDHAVLARSHGVLVKISAALQAADIPSLYFGDFFERAEIRDLLSLISVAGERHGLGLFRVGQFARYAIPVEDILRVFQARNAENISVLAALRRPEAAPDLSTEGRQGLQRLRDDLSGVAWTTTAHTLISDFLFNTGAIAEPPFNRDGAEGQQIRLAVYQLLQFAFAFRSKGQNDPKRAFLEHVRRLEVLDEEKELRRLPAAAANINAVRLMTVHASKGLEFPSVHIPSLSPSYFPANKRPDPCPPPPGIVSDHLLMSGEAEEESLFFVALSRAEETVSLSRALKYGGASRPEPSKFVKAIRQHLPVALEAAPNWTDQGPAPAPWPLLAPASPMAPAFTIQAIETYQRCPRRFYYGEALGLSTQASRTSSMRFHSVVRAGLKWLRDTPQAQRAAAWDAQFQETWTNLGPRDDSFTPVFKASAVRMLQTASAVMKAPSLAVERTLLLSGVSISALADYVAHDDGGVTIFRFKAGRLAKSGESPKARYGVLQKIVAEKEGAPARIAHVSLLDGAITSPKSESVDKVVESVEAAIAGIQAGRFDPVRSDRHCPNCPFFFVCPAEGILA